ncbi:MAG: molybdopterin-dependent oxidoreductase, partial [Alphaproteobacteria bacterium]|nr:molybdopterin-dependent oxidoreductase [Alphaproteobacteria bacterium]
VFTAADLAADGLPELAGGVDLARPDGTKLAQRRPILAGERVRFVGEAVALVIGQTQEAAAEAAERIDVRYEALPAVATSQEALAAGAAAVWDEAPDNIGFLWKRGDAAAVAAALKSAAHVTRLDFAITRVAASALEPRVCTGTVDEDGRLTLYVSHQSPYQLKTALAQAIFRIDPARLRVVAGDVGGSFGMKSGVHPEDVLVLWAARRLRRPVRWVSDRAEAFLADDHARDIRVRAALALDRDGNFLALEVRHDINVGAYLSGRSLSTINNIGGIAGVYRTPAISAEAYGVFTNTAPTAPYRGAGRPEATFTIERLIDVAAREIAIDPFELRRRNLVPQAAMPFRTALTFTYDCGDFAGNMAAAARLADLAGFSGRREAAKARGKLRGIGIANPIEVAGGPFGKPGKDTASLRVAPDGTVTLRTGAMSTGQGLETALAQLAAQRLGVPLETIAYGQGDTDHLPQGRGSGGSSALCVGGTAVAFALDKLVEKGRLLAAELLEAAAADIVFAQGRFAVAGTDRSVGLREVARFAENAAQLPPGMIPGLDGTAEFQPTEVTFPNGCHICEVEIDPETGAVRLERYSVVEDVGRVLNPLLVRGQVHGGVAQGAGQALGEVIIHESGTAQLLTASFLDYAMPHAGDLPEIRVETREVPTAVNPLGAKGVGEAGTVGALAATMNAVCDALAPLGLHHLDMPATPERIWAALRQHARS